MNAKVVHDSAHDNTAPVAHRAGKNTAQVTLAASNPYRKAPKSQAPAVRRAPWLRALALPLILTPLSLSIVEVSEPLLHESFASPAVAWPLPHPQGAHAAVTQGTLVLQLSGHDLDLVSYAPGSYRDTRMEITLTRQGASRAMAGLICRAPDTRVLQGAAFLLRGDGRHGLFRFGAERYDLLTQGQLDTPSSGAVQLALECVGDRLAAFVDGRKVAEGRVRGLPPEGLLGVVALTQGEEQAFTARFDEVRVTSSRVVSGPPLTAALSKSGDVLLRENFADPASGWPIDERARYHYVDERPRYHYADGQYRINLLGLHSAWSVTHDLLHPEPADVHGEVTLTLGPGPAGRAGGLTCRQVDTPEGSSNFYAFTVAADGAARITPFMNNQAGPPLAQVPAGTVGVQVGRPLRLHIECVGNRLTLLVGDHKVLEVHDRRLTAPGQVGVIATQPEPLEENAAVTWFDDLVLTRP